MGNNDLGTTANPITTLNFQSGALKNVATINGTAGLIKTTAGVLTLNANNYFGITAINGGTVQIDGADDLGNNSPTNTISLNTGTLRSTANSYDLGGNRDITLAGAGTIQNDAGTLTVSGDVTNGVNGLTLLGDGNIAMTGVIGAGATPTGGLTIGSATVGTSVTLGSNNLFTGKVDVVAGDIIATHSGSFGVGPKTVEATGNTGVNRPTLILDGSAGDLSFAANLTFLTSNNSLTDPAILNTAGNNRIQGALQLTSGGGDTAVVVNGGTLGLGAVSNVITSPRTLILGGTASGTVGGTISNGSNILSLQKVGAGTWTLAGNNSYTGITTVTAGALRVDGVHTGAGLVTVSAGATLGGGGTLVQVDVADGGVLSPGESAGHLTISDLTLHQASLLAFELDAPAVLQNPNSDFVTITSTLTLDGVLNITPLAGFGSPTQGARWLIMTSAGGISDNGVNIGSSPSLGSGLHFVVDASNGVDVFLTVVPEPAVGALFALALLVLRRRLK